MKLLRSFAFALNGIKICFASETNFKIHVVLTMTVILFGIGFHISPGEWLAILFCIAFVLAMEMMNTAVEKLCDVVRPDIHPGIKLVKDISAGAVLVSAIISFVISCIIFLPKIIHILKPV